MSRSLTDADLVNLMVAAPRNFSVIAPDVPPFNAKPGFALPPPSELVLNGIPASHVASEVIALVEQKRATESQRDELLAALDSLILFTKPSKSNAAALNNAYAAIARVKGEQQPFTEMGGVCRCDVCGFTWLEGEHTGAHTCKGGAA